MKILGICLVIFLFVGSAKSISLSKGMHSKSISEDTIRSMADAIKPKRESIIAEADGYHLQGEENKEKREKANHGVAQAALRQLEERGLTLQPSDVCNPDPCLDPGLMCRPNGSGGYTCSPRGTTGLDAYGR